MGLNSRSWGGRLHKTTFALPRQAILNELDKKFKANVNSEEEVLVVRLREMLPRTHPCAIAQGSKVSAQAQFAYYPAPAACVTV